VVVIGTAVKRREKQLADSEKLVAIVTGASSGIGAETAVAFARRGYVVFLAARRVEKLKQVAVRCREVGSEPRIVPTDVAERTQVEALVAAAIDEFGHVDVLVNNAGYGHFARVAELDEDELRRIFQVNFYGLLYGCQAVAPHMQRRRSGHIFNVSSIIGKRGTPFHGAYVASKFAVTGLSDSLRVEMIPYNVKVTTVCPALTATEFFDVSERGRAARSSFVNIKKMTSPQQVARRIASTVGKNKPEMVFTLGGKFLLLLNSLWPRGADLLMKFYHDDLARRLDGDGSGKQAGTP
jgi:short-subunit dehydrogenase